MKSWLTSFIYFKVSMDQSEGMSERLGSPPLDWGAAQAFSCSVVWRDCVAHAVRSRARVCAIRLAV